MRAVSGPLRWPQRACVSSLESVFVWGRRDGVGWGGESEEERKLFQERAITTYRGVRLLP